MPPRSVTLAIVGFWFATTAWLIYREMLPAFHTGDPPPFTIDLADEVSAQAIGWRVLQNGAEVGTARTAVRHQPDRTFVLEGEFKPLNLTFPGLAIKKVTSQYAVTRDGDLRELATRVKVFF